MNYAVIFAGGVGKRMNTNGIPKQFLKVQGTPIIIHTIRHFQKCKQIDGIVVVCVESHLDYMDSLVDEYNLNKVLKVVKGGNCGQKSIFNGLDALHSLNVNEKDIVLIHDGVRPLIDEDLIKRNISSVLGNGNAISSSISKETIVTINDKYEVTDITDRSKTYVAKAPQSFYFGDIYNTHLRAQKDDKYDFIDSCSLMQYYGFKPYIVECSSKNIKITTPEDYYIFKAILLSEENMEVMGA